MKSAIIAAVALAGAGMAAPAFAQDATTSVPSITSPQGYVTLGYTYLNPYKRDLGEITGRIGARIHPFVGVEGELGGGVVSNHFSSPEGIHQKMSEGITGAGYVVGFVPLPVMGGNKLDLLARVGYGVTPVTVEDYRGSTTNSTHSINYGAGLQYAFDGKNGLRFDYTRRDFQEDSVFHPRDIDTYSISFVRKF